MKTIKFLFAALAMTFAMNASAQDGHFIADVKLGGTNGGGAFGLGVGYQKPITEFEGCTLAWDIINFEYTAPFTSPADFDMLSLKTGLRLFSPSFASDKLRAYTNLAGGYTMCLAKGFDDKMKVNSAFGLTWGIGLQYKEKFSFGYTLLYETWAKSKYHMATFGYTF